MEKQTRLNQSVEKALQIIEVMASAREPMRLADLAQQVGMPPSTTLRMVNTLVEHRYAYQDVTTLRYALTFKFAQIGAMIGARFNIRDMARPYLAELSRRCAESTCLATEEDMELIYLDVIDGPDGMLKITQRIGKRAPMHSTGVGKLILTQYSREQLQRLIHTKGLVRLTDNTKTSPEALERELEIVRAQGYALDDEECELGARCVAAPIRNYEGRIVAGISVSGPIFRMSHARIMELIPPVIDTARQISAALASPAERHSSLHKENLGDV